MSGNSVLGALDFRRLGCFLQTASELHPGTSKAASSSAFGIYDVGRNTGFVNVGTDHDIGAFGVVSIRGWWHAEGQRPYPHARTLLITADGVGSNGYRLRQWKMEPQGVADKAGLAILVASRLRDDRPADCHDDHGQNGSM